VGHPLQFQPRETKQTAPGAANRALLPTIPPVSFAPTSASTPSATDTPPTLAASTWAPEDYEDTASYSVAALTADDITHMVQAFTPMMDKVAQEHAAGAAKTLHTMGRYQEETRYMLNRGHVSFPVPYDAALRLQKAVGAGRRESLGPDDGPLPESRTPRDSSQARSPHPSESRGLHTPQRSAPPLRNTMHTTPPPNRGTQQQNPPRQQASPSHQDPRPREAHHQGATTRPANHPQQTRFMPTRGSSATVAAVDFAGPHDYLMCLVEESTLCADCSQYISPATTNELYSALNQQRELQTSLLQVECRQPSFDEHAQAEFLARCQEERLDLIQRYTA